MVNSAGGEKRANGKSQNDVDERATRKCFLFLGCSFAPLLCLCLYAICIYGVVKYLTLMCDFIIYVFCDYARTASVSVDCN